MLGTLAALEKMDTAARQAAMRSLGETGDRRAIELLVTALLKDGAVEVRKEAAYALSLLPARLLKDEEPAIDALIGVLGNRGELPSVRGHVAEVLSGIENRRVVEQLRAAMTDPSAEVRFWSVFALGKLGDLSALPELEHLATTDESVVPNWWAVKDEAAWAIEAIRQQQQEREVEAVLQAQPPTYRALGDDLNDRRADVARRIIICRALGRLGNKRAVPILRSVLLNQDEVPALRYSAAQSLGDLGSTRATESLVEALLHDHDSRVRQSAAAALGRVRDQRAVDALVRMLDDQRQEPSVRAATAQALAAIGDRRAVPQLITALQDESAIVRSGAILALDKMEAPEALAELERLAAMDDAIVAMRGPIQRQALGAIARITARPGQSGGDG